MTISLWRKLKPIVILPGTVLVFVPAALLIFGPWSSAVAPWSQLVAGLVVATPGVVLARWTVHLFFTQGDRTPAPWDPPQKLVVKGPYRHVRNPMISGVLFMLAGEALIFQSWAIAVWGVVFFAANSIYFPLSEEKGLEKRFGEDYRLYKTNVPRWLPRLTPWNLPDEKSET